MPDLFSIDTSEFDRAIVDLQGLPRAVFHHGEQAVQQTARKTRDAWSEKLTGNPWAPYAPYSISFERIRGGTMEVEYEVGANKGTGQQGGVVLLLEYGAESVNLGARGYGLAALSENIEDLNNGVEKAIADGLREVGWS